MTSPEAEKKVSPPPRAAKAGVECKVKTGTVEDRIRAAAAAAAAAVTIEREDEGCLEVQKICGREE